MLTPPEGLKPIFFVQFMEPGTVEIKDEVSIESDPYTILKSELWPYPNPDLTTDEPNWHYAPAKTPITPSFWGADMKDACQYTADIAATDPDYHMTCSIGGEKVFMIPDIEARIPGHIYSSLGVDEYRITRICEYHFNEITRSEDE